MQSVEPPDVFTPAMAFLLMTGQAPAVRLPGWVALAQGESAGAAWAHHATEIRAAARAHDFQPFWDTHRRPTGPGFQRWRDAFLAEHRY